MKLSLLSILVFFMNGCGYQENYDEPCSGGNNGEVNCQYQDQIIEIDSETIQE